VPTPSFQVSNPSPPVGDSIIVDVVATDVTDLFAFNLDLGFDPLVLGVQSVDPGSFLASGGATLAGLGGLGFDLATPGEVQDVTDSLLGPVSGVTGAGVLARVTFGVVGVGTSPPTFLAVNAPAGTELVDSPGLGIFVSTQPGSVDAIPEPSTGALVAVGLGLLLAHRRRHCRLVAR
jgi:general secretion pathway protein D